MLMDEYFSCLLYTSVGLCGALGLSFAGFTYASAQAAATPKTSAEETVQMLSLIHI